LKSASKAKNASDRIPESSAEATHRGLLSITMGELNSDGGYMFEAKLQELLRLATTWGVVVLIDEADIFLEHRKSGPGANAVNNALVAVFLRHLEYFSGIVFLTSNRVSVFDAAVTSRIHLALQYSPPSANTRLELWSQSLSMIPTEDIDVDVDEVLSAVRQVEMNGREISNTLNTAMTLARHGERSFDWSTLRMSYTFGRTSIGVFLGWRRRKGTCLDKIP
jgi:SpoVK/Ycf46/Vps4 family AAA+-type ATPase